MNMETNFIECQECNQTCCGCTSVKLKEFNMHLCCGCSEEYYDNERFNADNEFDLDSGNAVFYPERIQDEWEY
jgi:hypothetical protein